MRKDKNSSLLLFPFHDRRSISFENRKKKSPVLQVLLFYDRRSISLSPVHLRFRFLPSMTFGLYLSSINKEQCSKLFFTGTERCNIACLFQVQYGTLQYGVCLESPAFGPRPDLQKSQQQEIGPHCSLLCFPS